MVAGRADDGDVVTGRLDGDLVAGSRDDDAARCMDGEDRMDRWLAMVCRQAERW